MAPHATADDPSVYIDAARVEQERAHECLSRFEGYLRRRGLLDDSLAAEIRAQAMTVMREGIAEAESFPAPSPDLVFDTAFANPPAVIAADRAELRRILAGEDA
jgi:pyruvate dehydrogenase E1 component alpha subunit